MPQIYQLLYGFINLYLIGLLSLLRLNYTLALSYQLFELFTDVNFIFLICQLLLSFTHINMFLLRLP